MNMNNNNSNSSNNKRHSIGVTSQNMKRPYQPNNSNNNNNASLTVTAGKTTPKCSIKFLIKSSKSELESMREEYSRKLCLCNGQVFGITKTDITVVLSDTLLYHIRITEPLLNKSKSGLRFKIRLPTNVRGSDPITADLYPPYDAMLCDEVIEIYKSVVILRKEWETNVEVPLNNEMKHIEKDKASLSFQFIKEVIEKKKTLAIDNLILNRKNLTSIKRKYEQEEEEIKNKRSECLEALHEFRKYSTMIGTYINKLENTIDLLKQGKGGNNEIVCNNRLRHLFQIKYDIQ